MSDDNPTPSKKSRHTSENLTLLNKEDILKKCQKQQERIELLEAKRNSGDDGSEKFKSAEPSRRENVLVMRLANKEQEVQEYVAQINHNKKVQEDAALLSLRQTNLDPGINLLFGKMREELQQTKNKLEQAQSELSAWKFTPDSQNGKKLIARCRTLIAENQELGRQLSHGKAAQLEAELALQKKYSEELKASQDELNEFVIQLDEEVEGMQSTIQVLQQQLAAAKQENEEYKKIVEAYQNNTYIKNHDEASIENRKSDYADSASLVSDENSVNGDNDFEMATHQRTPDATDSCGYARISDHFDNKYTDRDSDAAEYITTEELNSPGTPICENDQYETRTRRSSSRTPSQVDDVSDDEAAGDAWDDRTSNRSSRSGAEDMAASSYESDDDPKVQLRNRTPSDSDCSPANVASDKNLKYVDNNETTHSDKDQFSDFPVTKYQKENEIDTKNASISANGAHDTASLQSSILKSQCVTDVPVDDNALLTAQQSPKSDETERDIELKQDPIKQFPSQILKHETNEDRTADDEGVCDVSSLRNNHALSLNGVDENDEL